MSELPEILTKKIGPLPGGVWLLAIGGGLYIGQRRRASGAPDAAAGEPGEVGSTATRNGDAVEAPDEAPVPAPVYADPMPPSVLPDPGAGLVDAPGPGAAPAVTVQLVAPAAALPATGPRPPVPAGPSALAEAREAARVAFRNGHPVFTQQLEAAQRGQGIPSFRRWLGDHPDIRDTWARIGGRIP